jgi:hypothetical protein
MMEPRKAVRVNPLDALMTKAQVVRRKFKSTLPRTPKNLAPTKMEAMARTMELLDRFRSEMQAAGLSKNDVSAGLVYHQPTTVAETAALPAPEKIGTFVKKVMALAEPVVFLGVLFFQTDREAADKPDKFYTVFAWPFIGGPDAEKRLKAARDQQAKGGGKKVAN